MNGDRMYGQTALKKIKKISGPAKVQNRFFSSNEEPEHDVKKSDYIASLTIVEGGAAMLNNLIEHNKSSSYFHIISFRNRFQSTKFLLERTELQISV